MILLISILLLTGSCKYSNHSLTKNLYLEFVTQVQMQQVFHDSKTFIDCIPKVSKDSITQQYELQKDNSDFNLKSFVLTYYKVPTVTSTTYTSDTNASVSSHIHRLWTVLTRSNTSFEGSLLPLPYPYIVPGGRFNEIYYWDSYFTCLGLQTDKRFDLINDMVGNFAFLIDKYGFIPNGNREYFLSRSQPPFFSYMVELLAEIKGDSVIVHYLPELKKEYSFWMKGSDRVNEANRAINNSVLLHNGQILNRYWDKDASPRPEAFRIDSLNARTAKQAYKSYYRNIRSACESGWDFSSRWFKDGHSIQTIETTNILPIDLNVLLWNLENAIAKGALLSNDTILAKEFRKKANNRKKLILNVFWDDKAGYFMDFNFKTQKHTTCFSLAGAFPLFASLATQEQAKRVAQKLKDDFMCKYGLVTTLTKTGQQWDYPNGWAPLQWISIKGLENYHFNTLAKESAERWIKGNIDWYKKTGKLVEKYNVVTGIEGQGGEYPGQDGFGWTNGVLQKLMYEYHLQQ
ncbi:MAG: alpha,alpha-trehalase TreF [Parcubacteria group bacterium]|nr:alpha,alpha-trehalase TreF [Parcubacteria group bacterium]